MKFLRNKNFSVDWPNHIIGFLSALFGILIAFELDQWRERQQEQEVAQNAFAKLKQEIQINKNTLHEAVGTNLNLLSLLQTDVIPNLNTTLQFTGQRAHADSINHHKHLTEVVFIDTVAGSKERRDLPAHIVLGNLIQPVLQYSAWESAKATGALNFMDYEKVLTLSSLYNAPRIADELLQVKSLIRSSDQIKEKAQLVVMITELKKSHQLIYKELEQYDLFVNMIDQME